MKASKQVKIFVIAVLALLAVIIVLQNRVSTTTTLLFARVDMPLAILLIVLLGFGFVAGLITSGVWCAKK